MYLLFVIVKKTRKETFLIGILNASEEKSRIPIRNPEVRILIKRYGSGTLLVGLYGELEAGRQDVILHRARFWRK
jgi:hypothetical protein